MQNRLLSVAGLLVLATVLLNAANVIARYVFNSSLLWADEVLVYGNIWVVAVGGLAAAIAGEHLSTDVLRNYIGDGLARLQTVLVELVTVVVAVVAAYASVQAMQVVLRTGQTSVAAGLPMWIPHGAILFMFASAALFACIRLVRALARFGRDK